MARSPAIISALLMASGWAGTVTPAPDIAFTQRLPDGHTRVCRLGSDGRVRVLSEDFQDGADPEVSYDGKRLMFAGRKQAGDRWQIFEMPSVGGPSRRITDLPFDCRHPIYQSSVYVIASDRPWHQIAFVANNALYTTRMDGSDVRRITWTPLDDPHPQMLPDGRMVYASRHGNRTPLFGVNADGTDMAAFSTTEGALRKATPCVTGRGLVVFVEPFAADGAGALGSVRLRRNLHSYRNVTEPSAGLFRDPSPLPDGSILVSRRRPNGKYAVGRLDPDDGAFHELHANSRYDVLQAKAVTPRAEPDGRSSVVDLAKPTGKLYCLSVFTSDKPGIAAKRLRVLRATPGGAILGETGLESDGSFQLEVPANTPIRLQTLDANGKPIRTCSPVWARNNENRGCIGCHEDGELVPENRLAEALKKPAVRMGVKP